MVAVGAVVVEPELQQAFRAHSSPMIEDFIPQALDDAVGDAAAMLAMIDQYGLKAGPAGNG